jgi:hypothetical protein
MATRVTLDTAGIGNMLRSAPVAAAIAALTRAVAGNVQARGRPVTTGAGTTDRAVGQVSIAHPAGRAMQAKYGTLTRAAAAAGLEVRAR